MQFLGVSSFILDILSMYFIYIENMYMANFFFGTSMILFAGSLVLSLIEILQSTRALELELSDMDDMQDPKLLNFLRRFGRKEKP